MEIKCDGDERKSNREKMTEQRRHSEAKAMAFFQR